MKKIIQGHGVCSFYAEEKMKKNHVTIEINSPLALRCQNVNLFHGIKMACGGLDYDWTVKIKRLFFIILIQCLWGVNHFLAKVDGQ